MTPKLAIALLCGLLSTALAAPAGASTTYPEALRKKLELDAIAGTGPGCQLCHDSDAGGVKTSVKPFSRALQSAGATGASIPSLLAALDTLDAEGTDSDKDGAPDIDELRAGTDPNVAIGADGNVIPGEDIPLPQTGCTLSRSAEAPSSPTFALLLVAGLAFSQRRRLFW